MDKTPCATCPWQKENKPGGAGIPNFSMDMARGLRKTVGPDDAFRPIMACHCSPVGEESPCIGYVAVHGWSNLACRLMAARGSLDIRGIVDACRGLKLYKSFAAMLRAFEKAFRRNRHKQEKST